MTEGLFKPVASKAKLLAATALSMSCRLNGAGRTLAEIAKASEETMSNINKLQVKLCQDLKLELGRVAPDTVAARIGAALGLASHVIEKCRNTSQAMAQSDILDSAASGIVAAVSLMLTVQAVLLTQGEQQLLMPALQRRRLIVPSTAAAGGKPLLHTPPPTTTSIPKPISIVSSSGMSLDCQGSPTDDSSEVTKVCVGSFDSNASTIMQRLDLAVPLHGMMPLISSYAGLSVALLWKHYYQMIPHIPSLLPANMLSLLPLAARSSTEMLTSLFTVPPPSTSTSISSMSREDGMKTKIRKTSETSTLQSNRMHPSSGDSIVLCDSHDVYSTPSRLVTAVAAELGTKTGDSDSLSCQPSHTTFSSLSSPMHPPVGAVLTKDGNHDADGDERLVSVSVSVSVSELSKRCSSEMLVAELEEILQN